MKKTSKKALSFVLAVVMALTSLSVGYTAFAADDPYRTLADALMSDGVQGYNWPAGSTDDTSSDSYHYFRVTVTDNTAAGDIMTAAEAFYDVVESIGSNYLKSGQNDNGNLGQLRTDVLNTLTASYGLTQEYQSKAESALQCFTAYQNGKRQVTSIGAPGDLKNSDYVFTLTRSVADQLMTYSSVDAIPATLYETVTYTYPHTRASGSGWLSKPYWIYLSGWSRQQSDPNTAVPAAMKDFASFFTDELLSSNLSAMTSGELSQLAVDAQAKIDALGTDLWGNDDLMNHFFDKEAIETFVRNLGTARDNAVAKESAAGIKKLMDANDPAALELGELTALLSQINSLRDSLLTCSADAQTAGLAAAGTTMEAINAYIDSVELAIEIAEVTAAKQVIDDLLATLPEDLAAVESDDTILSALATIETQLSVINSKSPAAVNAVFPEGTGYVTDMQQKLQVEADVRALDQDMVGFGAYFHDKLLTDLTTLDTDTLLAWRTADRAEFEKLQTYAVEAIDRVYGAGYYAQVEAYIALIDTTLRARAEAQIDAAIENYDEYGAITILNYKAVQEAIGGVETAIIDTVGLTEEYQEKYSTFSAMMDEYNEFVATQGMSGWMTPQVDYPVRETPMAGDMARTAEEAYAVTPEKLETVIGSIDQLMHNEDLSGLIGLEGTVSDLVKGTIADNLYTDQMVNTIITTVYSLLTDIIDNLDLATVVEDAIGDAWYAGLAGGLVDMLASDLPGVMAQLGIVAYPQQVATYLSGPYPEAKAAMEAAGMDWDAYDMTTTWHVTDKESFISAVSYGLCGLQEVLRAVLTNQSYSGTAVSVLKATMEPINLYDTAIVPLLELLGCDNIMPTQEYNDRSRGEGEELQLYSQQLLPPILTPLLDWVESLADQPISYVLELLPKLAYVMEFDLITPILQNTNIKLALDVDLSVIQIPITDDLLSMALGDGSSNLYTLLTTLLAGDSGEGEEEGTSVSFDPAMLSDINKLIAFIFDMAAPDANLVLPTIDQAYLASLGTLSTGESARSSGQRIIYDADQPAVLLAVLRYVLPMLADQDFMDALLALVGQMTGSELSLSDDIMTILRGLGENPDGVICALTELFVPQTYKAKTLSWNYLPQETVDEEGNPVTVNQVINEVTYSADWTKEKAQYVSDNLSGFVNDMMLILGGEDMPTLGEMIQDMIAGQFYTNETINSVISLVMEQLEGIGIDLIPILQQLVGVDLSLWEKAYADPNYDWGVIPGDTETFKQGLKDALSPFAPIMATLMSGQKDLTILGTVTMKSYPGYRNGIIPLLEAIGCADEDIMPADQYEAMAADGTYDEMISAIIDPILNLVDRVYEDPINTLLDILPNVFYFLNNGNLQIAVENALQSVFVLLDTVRPIYNLNFDLNLNVQQIVLELLAGLEVNGMKLDLNIPFLVDLSMLCVGTVTPYDSKSGETAYRLTDVDRADFITIVMRNIVELIFYQDNLETIVELISSYAGLDTDDMETLKNILYTFADMYHEDNGVDKVLNAIYFIFRGMHTTGEGAITIVGGLNDRWKAIFEAFYNSGNPTLVGLAQAADKVLDFLSFGFINGSGIGTSGLIDFGDRVLAFFQGRVTDVSISQTEASLYEGQSMSLSLSFKPVTVKNKNVTWTSSNTSIATVENGVVTAVGPGDAEIKAVTQDGGFEVSCVVRVRADKSALQSALNRVDSLGLSEENLAAIADVLDNANRVLADELATQAEVNAATDALLNALPGLDLGEAVTAVTITQNGQPVGKVVYQKVPWTKRWNSTPAVLGVQVTGDYTDITWEYANWSVDDPEADIEQSEDGLSANIVAKNSVIGAHSCWIQVTVTDVYGNRVTSDPVKVRFYNWDWQK